MLISFIIPHKGREELLEQTIQSILDLEFDLQTIEIIVVTQNKTLECPYVQQGELPFKIVFRSEYDTISSLRNIGVENASGEYLALLDADIQVSQNWLNVMLKELQAHPERALVSAIQQYRPNPGIIEKIRVILYNTSADRSVKFLGGANLFMTRTIFQKVDGFPKDLTTCEDYYFTNKVTQIGEVYCTSKASFIHLGEDKSYPEMFRKEMWRGQANLQSLQGRKLTLREVPSIIVPLWQTFFFLATIISLFIGKVAITLFFLGMVCIPIILYAIRLYKISRNKVSFIDSIWFYCIYLFARVIGTTIGVFKIIRV